MTTPPYDQESEDRNDKQVNHYGYRPIDPDYQRWEVRFVIGLILYFITKAKALLFVAGVGAGILIGALWSYAIVMNILS